MKLYTEEEIRKFFTEKYDEGLSIDELIEILTPIELPRDLTLSDWKQAKEKYEHEMCLFADEYASYVQEQSKEGIKGAMVSMCAWTFFKNRRK
jgi:hypothetical protein